MLFIRTGTAFRLNGDRKFVCHPITIIPHANANYFNIKNNIITIKGNAYKKLLSIITTNTIHDNTHTRNKQN